MLVNGDVKVSSSSSSSSGGNPPVVSITNPSLADSQTPSNQSSGGKQVSVVRLAFFHGFFLIFGIFEKFSAPK